MEQKGNRIETQEEFITVINRSQPRDTSESGGSIGISGISRRY
jgi:hypothetical protein